MSDESPAWSTPKFLLIALATTFAVMFTLNGLLNEILDLGVPGGAFGAASGFVVAAMLPKWSWFRTRIKRES